MTGLDLAIWHGNIEAFDLLITLCSQHPASFGYGKLHAWLSDDGLCNAAREECTERRNNKYGLEARFTEKFQCVSSYDTDPDEIDYVLEGARTCRRLGHDHH